MDLQKESWTLRPNHVKALLKQSFSKSQVNIGMRMAENGAVRNLRILFGAIVAEVELPEEYLKGFEDEYESITTLFSVEIIFYHDHDEINLKRKCTCGDNLHCWHAAAVLHRMLEGQYHLFSGEFEDLSVLEFRKIPILEELLDFSAPHKYETEPISRDLELANANKYRELPVIDGSLKKSQERFASSNMGYIGHWCRSSKILLPSNEIVVTAESRYVEEEDRIPVIRLKHENGKVWIQCLTCDETTSKLCQHQYLLLNEGTQILSYHGLVDGTLDYNVYEKKYLQLLNITSEAFKKYYTLVLYKGETALVSNVENLRSEKWVNKTLTLINKIKFRKQLSTQMLEGNLLDGRSTKHAYLWMNVMEGNTNSILKFLTGSSLKRREGIHRNDRELVYFPNSMPADQKELATKLFIQTSEQDERKRFDQVRLTIEENMEQLNLAYHYVVTEYNEYSTISKSKTSFVKFSSDPLKAKFFFSKLDGMIKVSYELTVGDKAFDYEDVIYSNGIFCATKDTMYLQPSPELESFIELFQHNQELIVPFTNEEDFSKLVRGFQKNFDVVVEDGLGAELVFLEDIEYNILLREVGDYVIFEPRIKCGEFSLNAFDEDSYLVDGKLSQVSESDRMFLIEFLKGLHPSFDLDFQEQYYVFLEVKELINNKWFFSFSEACNDAGVNILGQKELTKFKYNRHRAEVSTHVVSGIDWFEVETKVKFGKTTVPTADWIRAVRNNESFVTLKDGSHGILPEEWLEKAKQMLAVADFEKGKLKISKYRYNVIDELFDEIDDEELFSEIAAKKQKLANYDSNKKYKVPKTVKAKLRSYQKDGFAWLNFLNESSFGGILADDMGLGKTIQVISFLASLKKTGAHLVIVPRSLLFNWAAELEKFCPSLKFIIHHGQQRSRQLDDLSKCDLIITTYDTAVKDVEWLKDYNFNYIVLDESQAIKNPNSKRYKALRVLQSYNKIAMTGTPIENNTMDLFAQLSFTSPGLLGSASHFKNSFAIPIDNKADVEAAALLRKLTHPFILRRTKEQVAKDLPEKTETVIYCEMGPAQRKLYDNLKRQIKIDLEEEIEDKGFAKARFKMLDGLLRLRQMCNSPLLINKSFKGSNANSVKIDILIQNLSEELDQHKALVFSQFTSLLAVVRTQLDALGIKYCYLDGSTKNRQAEVERFQNNSDIRIFLISIKAGNTGLNLTEADYVYILDPWWNPAVEAQAIDRTHRIGQDKQIFAYKLICKNTIEEKILKLQEKKKKLADDIIRTDESIFKALNKKSLMNLLD